MYFDLKQINILPRWWGELNFWHFFLTIDFPPDSDCSKISVTLKNPNSFLGRSYI